MHKGGTFLTVLLLSVLLFSCSKKSILTEKERDYLDTHELIVGLYGYYPPYQFVSEKEQIEGVFVDFVELIENKINYKFKRIKYSDWQALYKDIQEDEIDLIIDLNKTKKREKYLFFYQELFDTNYVIVTRKEDSNKINSLQKLTSKRVVIPENYAIEEVLTDAVPNLNIANEKDETACLIALNNGKYDAYVGPKPIANYIIKNQRLTNVKIATETLKKYSPTIAVHKNNEILAGIINKAIKEISYAELNNILESWLLADVKPWYKKLKFWVIILTLTLILFLASVLFNKYLKFKIKEQTQSLSTAVKKAKKSNQVKTNIIQNISHEIRTPMNGILGFSELLKKEDLTLNEKEEFIDHIIESGKNLIQIIDNIFEISNLQVDSIKLHPSPVFLPEIFDNIVAEFQTKAHDKNLKIEVTHPKKEKNLTISVDKERLVSSLRHLVDNAIKFTSKGKVELFYHLKAKILHIEIVDTGIGIKENNKEIIFESFSQLETEVARQYSGLGLGLSIAKLNIKYLKGALTFSSQEGLGTTFKISVPFNDVPNEYNERIIKPPKNNEIHTFTILIAEDVEINYLLLNSILTQFEPYKFEIIRALNGKEAVDICNKKGSKIDLIIMDIRMPVMDGYEATQIIKENFPNIPVIAHTAYSGDEDITNALQAGCDIVIPKPVNHHDFTKVLESYILKKNRKQKIETNAN